MKQKQFKRLCAMILTGVMVSGCFAGCGNEEPAVVSTDTAETAVTESVETESTEVESTEEAKLLVEGPVTLEMFTATQTDDASSGTDLYIFKWIEYWLAEQGYDVTINLTNGGGRSSDAATAVQLMLGTGLIPDMVWSPISGDQIVRYGMEEGMLLDWKPYINEKDMPNLYALCQQNPDAISLLETSDGGMYNLPAFFEREYHGVYSTVSDVHHVYVNSTIMKEAGYEELPTTTDDFINMLRGMVANHTHPEGFWGMAFFKRMTTNYLWYGPAGYYTWPGSNYGDTMMIKDGEVLLPAYTEDFRELVEGYHMMYEEGLLHPDFLTLDSNINNAMIANNQFGVFSGYGLGTAVGSEPKKEDYTQWLYAAPLTHSKTGRETIVSLTPSVRAGNVWASATTKYPELLVAIADYLYSDEGIFIYKYGPKAGEDPLNLVEGWTVGESETQPGKLELKQPAGFDSFGSYQYAKLHGCIDHWDQSDLRAVMSEMTGIPLDMVYRTHTDRITGQTLTFPDYTPDDETDVDANLSSWTRHIQRNWADNTTLVSLAREPYMSSEDAVVISDLKVVISDHINQNAAKFIVGERPLEEVDAFFEELKELGVEDYIKAYRKCYEPYMNAFFGK